MLFAPISRETPITRRRLEANARDIHVVSRTRRQIVGGSGSCATTTAFRTCSVSFNQHGLREHKNYC